MVKGSRLPQLAAMAALLVGLGLAAVPAELVSVAVAHSSQTRAPGIASSSIQGELAETEPTDGTEDGRPEGSAWIIGLIVFVAAVTLITAGRWWVRNRVGSVQR